MSSMKQWRRFGAWTGGITAILIVCTVYLSGYGTAVQEVSSSCDPTKNGLCFAPRISLLSETIKSASVPKIATPSWFVTPPTPSTRSVTYRIETRGVITADLNEFKSIASATLNDNRGWSRLGVRFNEVAEGGDFSLVLSEASQMTTFSASGCDTTYSCNVGRFVVINQDRWQGATPSWTTAGADIASYRNMVLNHETGHWLGHGHSACAGPGQAAAVMQQQSISLQGCTANSWPLIGEMYSPKLGIRS